MPCGFDTRRTIEEYNEILSKNQEWGKIKAVKDNAVFAVDANSFFSKPSIRTITGLEILAKTIHPENFETLNLPKGAVYRIPNFTEA